jgi:general secretion pathway protein D
VTFLDRAKHLGLGLGAAFLLASCGARKVAKTEGHLQPEPPRPPATIPSPVRAVPLPPPPEAREAEIRYSVVVANQPVREVLLAMARETKVNFDIHPGIEGTVNLNAIDQTLKQILTRIARQVDMRWEQDGQTITVMPDTPFLRSYKVNYVNMSRDVSGIDRRAEPGRRRPSASGGQSGSYASQGQNSSLLKIDNLGKNRFWESLEKNIKDLLRETDKQLPEGSSETYVQSRGQGRREDDARQRRSRNPAERPRQQSNTTLETPGRDAIAADQRGHGEPAHLPRGGLGHREHGDGCRHGARDVEDNTRRSRNSSRSPRARPSARSSSRRPSSRWC